MVKKKCPKGSFVLDFSNTGLQEKYKDDEGLKDLLIYICMANKNEKIKHLSSLKEKYPDVFDEYLKQTNIFVKKYLKSFKDEANFGLSVLREFDNDTYKDILNAIRKSDKFPVSLMLDLMSEENIDLTNWKIN